LNFNPTLTGLISAFILKVLKIQLIKDFNRSAFLIEDAKYWHG